MIAMSWTERYYQLKVLAPLILLGAAVLFVFALFTYGVINDLISKRRGKNKRRR